MEGRSTRTPSGSRSRPTGDAARRSGRLERLARLTTRYRWPVIVVWVVLTVVGGVAAGKLSTRWYQSTAIPGKPAYETGQRTLKAFGAGVRAPNVVVFHSSGDVTRSAAVRAAVARVDKASPGALTSSYFSTGSLAYVSSDRHTTFQEVYPPGRAGVDRKSGAVKMRAVAARGLPAGITVDVTGRDALDEANSHASNGSSSALLETLIGGLGALIILLFVFGTLPAVLMPLVVAVAAILNTFTLVWMLTYVTNVSVIVQFLIALVGLGVAIDYSLLMIFRFRDELREGNDVESALVETMTHAGHSVIVSGTTVGGRPAGDDRAAVAAPARDGHRRHADPRRLGLRLAHPAAGAACRTRDTDQPRSRDAQAAHRPRASGRRRLGTLGALRAPPPRCGRRSRSGDRRRVRGSRHAVERERGAAQVLPRHRDRHRRPQPACRRRNQSRRHEAAERPRRERRQRPTRRSETARRSRSRRGNRPARLAAGVELVRRGLRRHRRRSAGHPGHRRPRQRVSQGDERVAHRHRRHRPRLPPRAASAASPMPWGSSSY